MFSNCSSAHVRGIFIVISRPKFSFNNWLWPSMTVLQLRHNKLAKLLVSGRLCGRARCSLVAINRSRLYFIIGLAAAHARGNFIAITRSNLHVRSRLSNQVQLKWVGSC